MELAHAWLEVRCRKPALTYIRKDGTELLPLQKLTMKNLVDGGAAEHGSGQTRVLPNIEKERKKAAKSNLRVAMGWS